MNNLKIKNGILLAGGTGSRLLPLTAAINKHLLPIKDKFIIDYSIDKLISLGCENVYVILGGSHIDQVIKHLRDGSSKNVNIIYIYQDKPLGIAQAINLCKNQISTNFAVMLGDNIFDGDFSFNNSSNAQIMLTSHPNLNKFGVASISNNNIVKLEEKPEFLDLSLQNLAITGCYIFTSDFFDYYKDIKLSKRNEYEIVDIIKIYLQKNKLDYSTFNGTWSDSGTHDTLQYLQNYFYKKDLK